MVKEKIDKGLKIGVDEAGKGPVIGPMVLAGCLLDNETARDLEKLGVKDSKDLTQRRREFLENKIKESAISWDLIIFQPNDIDGNHDDGGNLNELEARFFSKIISNINTSFQNEYFHKNSNSSEDKKQKKIKVIVDCPAVRINNWKEKLLYNLPKSQMANLDLSCEHKADKNHISVAAASIIAKCEREREMKKLKEKYGDEIGSGYSSDPKTIDFVEKHAQKYQNDGIFRKSWQTWKTAFKKLGQRKLDF